LRNLKLATNQYSLIGLTSIEGNNRNLKYKTYIKRDQQGGGLLPCAIG
jgi:hypothetical protein